MKDAHRIVTTERELDKIDIFELEETVGSEGQNRGKHDGRIPESEPARLRLHLSCIMWARDTLGAPDSPRLVSIGRELDKIDIFEL